LTPSIATDSYLFTAKTLRIIIFNLYFPFIHDLFGKTPLSKDRTARIFGMNGAKGEKP